MNLGAPQRRKIRRRASPGTSHVHHSTSQKRGKEDITRPALHSENVDSSSFNSQGQYTFGLTSVRTQYWSERAEPHYHAGRETAFSIDQETPESKGMAVDQLLHPSHDIMQQSGGTESERCEKNSRDLMIRDICADLIIPADIYQYLSKQSFL